MKLDHRGLQVTTDSDAAIGAIDHYAHELLALGADTASVQAAADANPDCAMLQAYFVSHIINHHQYGTFFSSSEPGGAGSTTLSAKATTLATPTNTCGKWTLNLTATKLNLTSISQSSAMNPIALLINDGDDSGPFCFDIPDAIVGPVIVH